MSLRPVLAVTAFLLFTGCSSTVSPSPTPTPAETSSSGPAIATHSADLQSVRAPVPPTRVEVGSVGINVAVVPVGIQADGYMELPPDVAIAGWYKFGSDPGSPAGTTVISAHVDSLEYGLGPFSQLKALGVGAVISVSSADGSRQDYSVESVQSVLKSELPLAEIFDREGAPRLVLITCGGQFDSEQLNYSDNIVVVAVPVV